MINERGCFSVIRVRLLKHATFWTEDIGRICAKEIRELREHTLTASLYREI